MSNGQRFFSPSLCFCPIPILAQDVQIPAVFGQVNSFLASLLILKSLSFPILSLCTSHIQLLTVSLVVLSFFFSPEIPLFTPGTQEVHKSNSPPNYPCLSLLHTSTANGLFSIDCLVYIELQLLFPRSPKYSPSTNLTQEKSAEIPKDPPRRVTAAGTQCRHRKMLPRSAFIGSLVYEWMTLLLFFFLGRCVFG